MKKMSRLLALTLVLITALGILTGCKSKSEETSGVSDSQSTEQEKTDDTNSKKIYNTLDEIKGNKVIKIGVFSDKPPFGFIDENGENQGFDVFIGKRLAKELLGDENAVEFVLVEAAARVEYLETGKVDLILANFTVTEERKEKVDFANPYMKTALGVVSKDGALITDVTQLAGKKLIVNKGTTAETYFTENHPEIELLKYEQNTEAFSALIDGRGDALAHDNTLLFAWAIENKGFTTGIEALGNQDYIAPAVSKGNTELLNWVNETLKSLGSENFIRSAYDATLLPVYGDTVSPDSVVIEGGIVE